MGSSSVTKPSFQCKLFLKEGKNAILLSGRDKAGNTTTDHIFVTLDTVLPIILAQIDPPPNTQGWHNRDVTVSFQCSDAGSGIAACSPSTTIKTEGTDQVITGEATDGAGNKSSMSVRLNIDKTPPVIKTVLSPLPNAKGWHNQDVTVTFTASDTVSLISHVTSPVLVVQEGESQIVTGIASDRAGNVATRTVSVSLDKTPPLVSLSQPEQGSIHPRFPITVRGIALDKYSIVLVKVNGEEVGNPFTTEVPFLDEVFQKITTEAYDIAGNRGEYQVTVYGDYLQEIRIQLGRLLSIQQQIDYLTLK